ncbi:hypothetical protein acdb102_44340 [Acidothermaceae bacterium B102]|nr:hypothetical protein acdb102_44340 [Acidothermaceae bacterium B102]
MSCEVSDFIVVDVLNRRKGEPESIRYQLSVGVVHVYIHQAIDFCCSQDLLPPGSKVASAAHGQDRLGQAAPPVARLGDGAPVTRPAVRTYQVSGPGR